MRASAIAVVCAAFGFYFWTLATSVPVLPPVQGRETDFFNLLAHGFLKGQLSLDYAVPKALLEAEDPYDPDKRPPGSSLHDASLYHGKYYIYFGAAPVVTLLVPFILATGRDLPLSYGIFFFGGLGYLALIALFLHLRRRYFPGAGRWESLLCLLALSFATPISILFRRHSLYEFPIASGFCFFMVSLLCFSRSWGARNPRRWLVAAGLCLGMAIGSRPTYAFCSCIFLVPFIIRPKDAAFRYGLREFLSAVVPLGLIVSVILTYNYERFANPLEFGVTYELSGIVESKARHFSLGYIPLNIWVYFFAPLRWGRYFPFTHGIGPQSLPTGYGEIEGAFGALTNLPFLFFSLIPIVIAFSNRVRFRCWTDRDLAIAILAASCGAVSAFLCCFYWAVARYMTDFTPGLALLASLGLLAASEACASRRIRALPLTLGWAAFLAAAFVALAWNFQSYGKFQQWSPGTYGAVSQVMDTPLFRLRGPKSTDIGPLRISLQMPPGKRGNREYLVETGWPDSTDRLFMEQPDAGHVRFGYLHGDDGPAIVSGPVAVLPNQSQSLEVDLGSLYPPPRHPFYRGMSDAEISHLRNWVRVRWNGDSIWQEPAQFYDASPESVRVGKRAQSPEGEAGFAGAVVLGERGAIRMGSDPAWPDGGARMKFTLAPGQAGRSLPLASTGQIGQGDALFLRVLPDGKAQFGYDHWGKPVLESAIVPLSIGTEHRIEFWMPSMMKSSPTQPLKVMLDGQEAWHEKAEFYPCGRFQIFLARNVTGASTCEAVFEGAEGEALGDEVTALQK